MHAMYSKDSTSDTLPAASSMHCGDHGKPARSTSGNKSMPALASSEPKATPRDSLSNCVDAHKGVINAWLCQHQRLEDDLDRIHGFLAERTRTRSSHGFVETFTAGQMSAWHLSHKITLLVADAPGPANLAARRWPGNSKACRVAPSWCESTRSPWGLFLKLIGRP